ncbi:MAG: hypothetical protein M5U30_03425 [Burkholderiaceae bacterium]|nr:hypothetical protein [Burkholderiaceae bacterium]
MTTIQVVPAATIAACAPAACPQSRRAVYATATTVRKPVRPGHSRAAKSLTPNRRKASAPIQYCSAGFSK